MKLGAKVLRTFTLALAALSLSGCLGQLIIGSDVDPFLGRKWQDYDYAKPNASCGKPWDDKYGRHYVSCTTDQYTVTFRIDDGDRIQSYRGSLRD